LSGVFAVALFARGARNVEQSTPVAAIAATATLLPTAIPLPAVSTQAPTADVAQEACAAIVAAGQLQQWQQVVNLTVALAAHTQPAVTACDGRALVDFESEARFQVGLAAYNAGDYSSAVQQWVAAQQLGYVSVTPLDLLMDCATARTAEAAALYVLLVDTYGVGAVTAQCGFDPSGYLPVPPTPTVHLDLLQAMETRYVTLFDACPSTPCPALYQDGERRWHLNTFFENSSPLAVGLISKFSK